MTDNNKERILVEIKKLNQIRDELADKYSETMSQWEHQPSAFRGFLKGFDASTEYWQARTSKLIEALEFYADGTNYESIYEDDEMDLHRIIDREDVSFDEDHIYFGHAGEKARKALKDFREGK